MIYFTHDELQLMSIYDTGTKEGLMEELKTMRQHLGSDEPELIALTDSVQEKLKLLTEAEYEVLDLIPDFGEEDADAV